MRVWEMHLRKEIFWAEDLVRSELRKDLDILKDCHVEVIMKDNHTLGGSKENAVRWCRIAREEIERLQKSCYC